MPSADGQRFDRFVAIDWSGARGERHRGIAVATCRPGDAAPALILPPHGRWSRPDVVDWLVAAASRERVLAGFDFGASLAFVDEGAFFPGWSRSPADARTLWALVEQVCADDPHLGAGRFVDHQEASRHFRRHGGRRGDLFHPGAGRMRVTEVESRRQGIANPVSNFNLVGAAQVGKSSLTGMRALLRIAGHMPVWPFDPMPATGSVTVEIYTSIAAVAAGLPKGRSKVRDGPRLDAALARLGSAPHRPLPAYDDHATDALMTAAWLRNVADRVALWAPARMTPGIATTEGWTFGVP